MPLLMVLALCCAFRATRADAFRKQRVHDDHHDDRGIGIYRFVADTEPDLAAFAAPYHE